MDCAGWCWCCNACASVRGVEPGAGGGLRAWVWVRRMGRGEGSRARFGEVGESKAAAPSAACVGMRGVFTNQETGALSIGWLRPPGPPPGLKALTLHDVGGQGEGSANKAQNSGLIADLPGCGGGGGGVGVVRSGWGVGGWGSGGGGGVGVGVGVA